MPFWYNWLHSESPSSGCMLCLLTKFLDYNLCIFFLINLPFIFKIWDIHRKFSCLEEDSSEKKKSEMWWHPIVIIYMLSLKNSVNVFQEIFLVSSKAASYIFYSREDRFCWITVILPAYFFSLMQNILDFLFQSHEWLVTTDDYLSADYGIQYRALFENIVTLFYAGSNIVRCYYIYI